VFMSEVIQVAFQVPIDDLRRLDATVPDEFPSRAAALRSILDAWLTDRRSLEIDRQLERGYAEVPEATATTAALSDAAIEGLRAADLDW
jgi:metal-responsive CopG/Arc/MetJ family transcriptional regulator